MSYVRALLISFLTLASASLAESATATWDRNTDSYTVGYVLSYGTQPGGPTVAIDVGNATTCQFFPPGGQRYYVVVQAYNASHTLGPKSAEVIYDAPLNQAPTLQQPANQSSVLNGWVSLALIGSDPEGAPLTYGASGLPAGLSINATTGIIAGTVTTVGTFPVIATVSDGSSTASRTFTWTVSAPANQAPTLQQPSNQSTTQNTAVSLALVGSDPEGAPLAYGATGLPAGLTVNATTGVITGTVTTPGTFNVTVTVTDGSLTASRAFTWTVTAPVNQAPTLQQPADQSSTQNTAVSLTLVGTDPEGSALTYSATGLPTGLTVNAITGVISGTVTTQGTFTVTARVSDGTLTASRTLIWSVTPATTTQTIVLSPIDTSLNLDSVNYSNDPRLRTYTWPTRKIANAIVMKFDLTQIPSDATIDSATLNLWLVAADSSKSDPGYQVTLHQVVHKNPDLTRATGRTYDGVNVWTASSCCSQNVPLAQADITPPLAALTVNRTPGAKTWDARELIRNWQADSASNFGLLLNADATKRADRYRFFASMEDPNVNQRPFMRVTFTVPAPTTETGIVSQPAPLMTTLAANTIVAPDVAAADRLTGQVAESGDQPVRGDFDGDSIADAATFRFATAEWRVWLSSANFAPSLPTVWGAAGDLPMAADYDGDARTDVAVYRPSTGTWHVLLSGTNNLRTLDVQWGDAGDLPLAFDYDGDGRADLVLPRSNGFEILLSGSSYTASVTVR